jgi:hypothetical protein
LAALTILADIMGPTRLREFGLALNGRNLLAASWRFLNSRRLTQIVFVLAIVLLISLPITLVLYWSVIFSASHEEDSIFYGLLRVQLVLLTSLMAAFLLPLLGIVLDFTLFRPIAYFLYHPSNERLIKIMSVFLLLVGFHFDLLTS